MKTHFLLLLMTTSCWLSCRSPKSDPVTPIKDSPATPTEQVDASSPNSGTLVKTMIVQSADKGSDYEGPRYEYQYSYDTKNRLMKLDFWGYLYKYLDKSSGSYANFEHRIATLDYGPSGELTSLHLSEYDQTGQPTSSLTFPVQKEDGELVVYGKEQFYPNPVGAGPIFKINATRQITQLPRPWNSRPDVQFGIHRLDYDTVGNLSGIFFSHQGFDLNGQRTLQQSPVLFQIEHSQQVLNPFGQDPAYGAAHFLVRGGLDFSLPTWLDVSKNMVLSYTTALYTIEETGPAFSSGSSYQTVFSYTYNTQNLPVSIEKKDPAGRFVYQITFRY